MPLDAVGEMETKNLEGKTIILQEVFVGEDIEAEEVTVPQARTNVFWHRLFSRLTPPTIDMDLDEAVREIDAWEMNASGMLFIAACAMVMLVYLLFGASIVAEVASWILFGIAMIFSRLPPILWIRPNPQSSPRAS